MLANADSSMTSETFSSEAGLIVRSSSNCTGSEQKLYDTCFDIFEHNECSFAVLNCQSGMINLCVQDDIFLQLI